MIHFQLHHRPASTELYPVASDIPHPSGAENKKDIQKAAPILGYSDSAGSLPKAIDVEYVSIKGDGNASTANNKHKNHLGL